MKQLNAFRLGNNEISELCEPIFLPDIGTFFNQDMALATSMVNQLSDSGITTIKGEILHSPKICLKDSGEEVFWSRGSKKLHKENYRKLIERKVVPLEAYEALFQHCKAKGMDVVVSVYDFEGADFAKRQEMSAVKIASSNITHQPLIEYVAKLDIPLILDTGHSTIEEIARAINWLHDAGAYDIIIEHSPPGPPNGVELHNLRFMKTLGDTFGIPYGLSDHHAGEEMLFAAVSLGATLIEKGVCPDGLSDEQDAAHALSISRVESVVKKIKNIYLAMGNGTRILPRNREKYRSRMGLVAKKDLTAGDIITLDTVTFAFPARGIEVENWREVQGSALKRSVEAGTIIRWQDLHDFTS